MPICSAKIEESLLQDISSKLLSLAEQKCAIEDYGYECDSLNNINKDVEKLSTYLEVVESENKKIKQGASPCLECEELQILIEKIIEKTGVSCEGYYELIEVDSSQEDAWKEINPFCQSYEDWQEASFEFCKDIELDIVAEKRCTADLEVEFSSKDADNLYLDVHRGYIGEEVFDAATKYKNNIQLDIELSDKEIQVELDIIRKETGKDIELLLYKSLVEDFSADLQIVKSVYKHNAELIIKKNKVYIKTPSLICEFEKLATSKE